MKNNKLYVSITLVVLFIINTILVINNKYLYIDDVIHSNVLHMHSEITTKIMKIITFFGSTAFMVGFACGIFLIYIIRKYYKKGIIFPSVLIISTLINNIVKIIIRRQRPVYMTVVENTFSYPSGHMMASVTGYGMLIYFIITSQMPKKYKIFYSSFLSILIVLVGISRIYLGAHFFSDIFGALLLSSSIVLLFAHLNSKYKWI